MPTLRSLAVICLVALAACAGGNWEKVRSEDTASAYRRFLQHNPRSPHAAEAQERLAVLAFEQAPSPEALERFRREHPDSAALSEMRTRVENRAFDATRAQATVAAYDRFLAAFPGSTLEARAHGNRAFLAAGGFAGDAASLALFLQEHPESDHAAEAARSLATLEGAAAGFGAVSLSIEIAPGVGDADRLRTVFTERARDLYRDAGARITDGVAPATLHIRHAERQVAADGHGGVLTRPGVLAETDVSLVVAGRNEPEFVDRISWRVPVTDARAGSSILFTRGASAYWDRFYVPVMSWPTAAAKRGAWQANAALVAVDAVPGRALALAPDGSFQDLDLSDPSQIRVVGTYTRTGAPAQFSGARFVGDRVVLFGNDGIEIVARQSGSYRRLASLDRGVVGGVSGVEEVEGRLLVAGTRGLVGVPIDGDAGGVERLVERPLRGIATRGDTLYVIDDRWLYAAPSRNPRATSFFTAGEFGRTLHARMLRVRGPIGVVVGDAGVTSFDLSPQGVARPLARMRTNEVGAVADAAVIGERVFLLGERGLLVIDPRSGHIVDSVDVHARGSLGVAGGHLVSAGETRVEVVDIAPWITHATPASLGH